MRCHLQPANCASPACACCTPLLRWPLHAHNSPLQALLDAGVTILGKNVMDEMVSILSLVWQQPGHLRQGVVGLSRQPA